MNLGLRGRGSLGTSKRVTDEIAQGMYLTMDKSEGPLYSKRRGRG